MSQDMGVIEVTAVLPPLRTPSGGVSLGRLTTSEEQRAEVIEQMTELATRRRVNEVKATVNWSRGEPTVLEIVFVTEHIEGVPLRLPDRITEYTLSGGVVQPSTDARLRNLQDEIADLHERQML